MKDVSVSMEEAHWGGGNDPTLFISSPVFAGEFPAETERETESFLRRDWSCWW